MKQLLKNGSFQAFLWTQFLGALNDNLYKTFVSLHAVHIAAEGGTEYLAIAGIVFVVPFLLFSGYSGHLADRYSKRSVLVGVKVFEIGAMSLGMVALFSRSIPLMMVVLFLMALHSTVFSPAKYGIVPEMLPDKELSRANGLLEMSTFVAIVLGTALSSYYYDNPVPLFVAMVVLAVIGLGASLRIERVPPSGASEPFRLNPFAEVAKGTRQLMNDRPLWLTVLGISYFWMLGALFQMDLLLYGSETLRVDSPHIGLMVTALAVGIGAGSLLAGKLSGDRVELGLVPVGSIGMGISSLLLYSARSSYAGSMVALAGLGLASGLFIVPLNAFLQYRGERAGKGRLIATNNFFNTIGLLIASAALWLFHDRLAVTPEKLILGAGFLTIGATAYIIHLMPMFLVRLFVRFMMFVLYRVRVVGGERVPQKGGALLVSSHVSLMDGFLVGIAAQHRHVRFMIWRPYFEHWAFRGVLETLHAIPVGTGPRDMVTAMRACRAELEAGHVVCIFAEGAVTRTGNLLPFKRGMEKVVQGLDIPVIPVHLDRVWSTFFSFAGGKFFNRKWPKRFPYPVTVSFGEPLPAGATAQDARQAVAELASYASELRQEPGDTLPARFIATARRNWGKFAMADSSGKELTYGRTLTAAVLLSKVIRKQTGDDRMVGLLLPSTVGGALANLGVSLAGKIPVNLNFTSGKEAMALAIQQCGIRTVITSKVFLAKAKLDRPEGAVFLEDILAAQSKYTKLAALLKARLAPRRMLTPPCDPGALATIIFSSGSTGIPKGVMLSHYNIVSNVDAVLELFALDSHDRIMGILPFFHSFGFMATIWLPLLTGCGAVYHPVPTDAKTIGELIQKYKGTFLLSTPTFCGTYLRKCTKEQFASLRFVVVGAEKLREPLRIEFREVFGLELLEGYGCTELSPVVAVNTPDYPMGRDTQLGTKYGTVGIPLPGIAVRAVDIETRAPLPPGQEGLLLVRGPNRMQGYLGQPERTAEVLHDGWYITGDIGRVDEDGFVAITDRLSRFSKIGGEMVPHLKIEDSISKACGDAPCAVTGLPDERKGERLAVLYTNQELSPEELWRRLSETDLPKLWIPKLENIHQVEALPVLGTGKLDLRGVKTMALELSQGVARQ